MALKQFTSGERLLASDLNSMVDAIQITEITWSNLKTLRDSSKLIPGATYRITDYTCTTVQEGTQSAGHVFDILVTADDVNVLNENAHAIQHSGDTYFANSDLSAWELKYCLDNDTTQFAWADSSSKGRGVVYYMKDELFNECPYDFKNIQFKLVKLSSINWKSGISSDLQSSYNKQFVGNYVGDWFTVNESGTANLNTGDTKYFYTFSGALDVDGTVEGTIGRFGNNTIEPYYDNDNGGRTYAMLLNHIVIMDNDGNDTDNMTSNKFGGNCHNIFVFGYSFNNNTFGNEFKCNTFGNNCNYNTFGNKCFNNTFGNFCTTNTFGNSCKYNTFGNSCFNNTFGNNLTYNTFGNSCKYNTFGNYLQYNTFGNDCYKNTFGNKCYYNTFGNYLQYNTFGNDYIYYCTFFDGVAYLNVSITATNTNKLQNMQVLNGTQGTGGSKLQITGSTYVTAGRAYTTTIGMNSSGTLTSKVLMDA